MFETIRVYNGRTWLLNGHLDRILDSVAPLLDIPLQNGEYILEHITLADEVFITNSVM